MYGISLNLKIDDNKFVDEDLFDYISCGTNIAFLELKRDYEIDDIKRTIPIDLNQLGESIKKMVKNIEIEEGVKIWDIKLTVT